jgi:hypothetical protein
LGRYTTDDQRATDFGLMKIDATGRGLRVEMA